MPGSGIREIIELASTLPGVVHLEVGQPSFRTPDHIVESALAAALAGGTGYTSSFGLPSLRAAIAQRYARKWSTDVSPDEVLVTHGAVNAIAAAAFALLDRGDEMLVPDPGWPNYRSVAALTGATAVPYRLAAADGYRPDLTQMAGLLTPRTKVLLLCNPSNPTGSVWDEATVAAVMGFADQHDLWVISDEIYEDLVFDGAHVPARAKDPHGRVVSVSGVSKTYAMTGWRLGWLVAAPELVRLAGTVQEPLVTCASSVSQAAALAALSGPQGDAEMMRDTYRRRRGAAEALLGPAGLLPVRPHGAFYAMVDLRRAGSTSRDLALALLQEERVACVPGSAFGESAEGLVRISLAASDDDIIEGCRRIVDFAARNA